MAGRWAVVLLAVFVCCLRPAFGSDPSGSQWHFARGGVALSYVPAIAMGRIMAGLASDQRGARGSALARALLCITFGSRAALALDADILPTQLAIETWSVRDGLPEGAVQALIQSLDGHLWVATQTGVATFDGELFTQQELPGLATRWNDAKVLLESSDGAIWVSAADRLARLQGGGASSYGEAQGLHHPYVYALLEEPGGCLWAGTGSAGLWCLRDGRFSQRIEPGAAGLDGNVLALASEPGVGLWLATRSGLGLVGARVPLRRFGLVDGLPSEWVNTVYRDRKGRLWVGTRAGLAARDGERFVAEGPFRGPRDVRALVEDRDGSLWIGTHDQGLWRLAHGEVVRLDRATGLPDDTVLALLEDRQGSLWVGTGRGLIRIQTPVFNAWGSPEGLPDEDVFAVASSADAVWLGDARGALVRFSKGRFETVAPPGTAIGGVRSIAIDAAGGVWFSGQALHRFGGGRVTTFSHGHGGMTTLRVDGKGLLLSQALEGGGQSLLRFEAGRFTVLSPGQPLPCVRVHDIRREAQGTIWVSTEPGGLYRLGERLRAYRRSDGLPHDTVYGLHLDANGVWAATRGGLALVRESGVFAFDERHGLPAETLTRLVEDERGDLWVSGNIGVFRVPKRELLEVADGHQPRALHLETFGMEDGLRVVQSSWRPDAFARAADGRLWLAGARGVAVANPRRRMPTAEPPVVLIPEIQVDERTVGREELLRLRARSSRIAIRYTVTDLLSARRLRFRYRLQGFEPDWVEAGARRTAFYTNLSPGDYTFRVEARREPASWGGGVSLSLRVAPLWYQRRAMLVLGLFAATALAFAAHRWRVASLERRERDLDRRVRESTEDLQRLNTELDARVRARTAQLEQASTVLAAEKEHLAVALAALSESSQRFGTVFRGAPMGIAIANAEGRFLETNDYFRKLLGYSEDEMRALAFMDITHPEDRERTGALAEGVRSGGADVYEMEKRYLTKDGAIVRGRIHATALRTPEGAVDYWIGIIEDITERKRLDEERVNLQAQLLQAQKMESVGRLAGGVAHDFNNLLHVIMGFVELLRRRMPADTRLASYVDEIERAAARAQDVTRQLLAFSRRQVISPAPSDLNRLVTRLSGGLSRLIGEDIELRVDSTDGLWLVNVDPTQIDQVLLNLAVNARDAMPNGGKLTIEMANIRLDESYCRRHATARPGDYVLLAFSDTGIGMDKETLSHAFEPFFTTKGEEKGTGLGLATVHGIVEQNGGFVNVYSEPGQGTTFRIYLPRALDAAAAATAAAERPDHVGAGTVLVAEDEESVRRITAALVQSLGYEVMTAGSGDEAIELCKADEPRIDVVLTDVVMPGTRGRELRDRLERLRPGIKILFTSGYTADVIAHQGILDKGVHFIAKPFGIADLARALRELLAAERERGL
jgi:PAS domain S-box-containing protein